MKKLALFLTCLCFIVAFETKAQLQVKDRNVNYQLERQVSTRWNQFRPKWYFWLFHRKYDDKDRRNLLQLAPTLVALSTNERNTEDQQLNTDTLATILLKDAAIRVSQPLFQFYFKEQLSELDGHFRKELDQLVQNKADSEVQFFFENKKSRIDQRVDIVRQGYLSAGELNQAFLDLQADYENLIVEMRRMNRIHKLLIMAR